MISLNNYQWSQNIAQYFKSLETESNDSLKDVTLISEDLKQVKAHSFVLEVGSLFFRNILNQFPVNTVKVLYIRGAEYDCLENILKFLYTGQVKVNQSRLEDFMKIANDMKIIGLMGLEENTKICPKVNENDEKIIYTEISKDFERHYMNMSGSSGSYVSEALTNHKYASLDHIYTNIDKKDVAEGKGIDKDVQYQQYFREEGPIINDENIICDLCEKKFKNKKSFKIHCYKFHTHDKLLQKSLIAMT